MAKQENTKIKEESQDLKICCKCGGKKSHSEFYNNKASKDGKQYRCKDCNNADFKLYKERLPDAYLKSREKNKEKRLEYQRNYSRIHREAVKDKLKQYYKANKDKIKEYQREYNELNKEKIKEYREANKDFIRERLREYNKSEKGRRTHKRYRKRYYKENRDRILERRREHRKKNKEAASIARKTWRLKNLERERQKGREANKRRTSTIKGKLSANLSAAINESLKKGKQGWHWEDLVGYTIDDLIKRLKKALPKGATWKDFTKNRSKYHVDHIIPKVCFNYETPNDLDFKKCWALSNLQILSARENVRKQAKITKPFQPSLLLKMT